MDIRDALAPRLDHLREIYTDLHRHPELGLAESRTAGVIEAELTDLGLEPLRIGGTGVVAVLENGEGPTVLARADTDALPVAEATGLDHASTVDGVMHACGHDMHVTALLGAVALLAADREAWSGTYVALFQPSEEDARGAQAMLDDGLTDRVPRPDVALAQHVMPMAAGTVAVAPGPVLSAGDSLRITLHGRGAHGSMPHTAVDPVVLAASVVQRLQTVVSREVEPGTFAVVTVGALQAGTSANIIPDRAGLLLNLRTYDAAVREHVVEAIERIVRGECAAAGSPKEPELEYYDRFPLTDNDPAATSTTADALRAELGEDAVLEAEPRTASEDFSRIPDAFGTPYTYWFVGGVDAEEYEEAERSGTVAQVIPANHSPQFAPVVDPTLEVAVRAQVAAALGHLGARH